MEQDAAWADSISGTGPGSIAPDGSPVDFYASIPIDDEPALIQGIVPAGGAILELGAGAGRLAMPLADLGFSVVAVDESPEMLAMIHGPETVCARIEEVRLDRTFDAVILSSYLVNWPDDALRHRFLQTCRAHVRAGGTVLLEWQPSEWYDGLPPEIVHDDSAQPEPDRSIEAPYAIRMISLSRPSDAIVAATVEYRAGERLWTQSFVSQRLTDDEIASDLRRVGLSLAEFHTLERSWVAAIPV